MRHAPLALLIGLCLATAACSGSDPGPVAPAPTASPTQASATPLPDDPLSPRPAVESPAPTGKQPVCAASALTIADADLLADDERLQEVFVVRTTGPDCALRGWPKIGLLDGEGAPLSAAMTQVGTAGETTLSRDSSLSFVLGTPRTQDCLDVTTVEVRLPGTNATIRTSTTMQVCAGRLEIGPVERRQDDEGAEH